MAARAAAAPGEALGQRLIHPQALLKHMLLLTKAHQACLVAGDPIELMRMNGAVELLLEGGELCHDPKVPGDAVSPEVAREVVRLARELRRELRANYALACHGAKLVGFPLTLLAGAGSACGGGPRLVDGSG